METDPCPKCGSTERDRGELFPKGVLWNIGFKPAKDWFFRPKKTVQATACLSCGYIELYLKAKE